MSLFISEEAASLETAQKKISSQDFVESSSLIISKILPSKIGGWPIHKKIGGGYFLAIGIGFIGSLSGLAIADYYQGKGVNQLNDAHLQAQLLGNFKDSTLAAQLQGAQLDSFVASPFLIKNRPFTLPSQPLQFSYLAGKFLVFRVVVLLLPTLKLILRPICNY